MIETEEMLCCIFMLQRRIKEAIEILENHNDNYSGAVYDALSILKGDE